MRILVLDVDGVLTDNRVLYDADGLVLKSFSVLDGLGIKLLQRAGFEVAVISGLDNAQARRRLNELGVAEFNGGHRRKLPILEDMLRARGLDMSHVAYMGDDLLDLPVMAAVGLPMAPADAQPEALRLAAWISRKPGGCGAIREAVRLLLTARGADMAQQEV
ncbi:HAD-IIIA family hydrolase [Fundidesulfovibrio agrisoli]|uniref:KdsC family phosphatase n=1 Tax=Fundidesulfovibrio agrisoli TaxID=2922717 RepID=UPI00311A9824